MKTIQEQYQEIKEQLDFNQREYKDKQDQLLKKIKELQSICPHDNMGRFLIGNQVCVKCVDCDKIVEK